MSDKESDSSTTVEPKKTETDTEAPASKSSEKKQKKEKKKKDEKDRSKSRKSQKGISMQDEVSETSEMEIVSQPELVSGKEYPMRQDEIIYTTSAQLLNRSKSTSGDIYITHKALVFASRQVRPSFYVELLWPNVKEIKRTHKRGYDKSITITLADSHVIFTSVKDRDTFMTFTRMIKKSYKSIKLNQSNNDNIPTSNNNETEATNNDTNKITNENKSTVLPSTYGFIAKNDAAEVVWKINVLKAPHVFEDTVNVKFQQVFEKFRAADILNDMAIDCGAHEYVASSWKSGDGLSRNVSFIQPMLNPPSVMTKQILRKSGNAAVLESSYVFSRASAPSFLSMNMQIYCKEEGDTTQLRGAFILEWNKETWDKEFVEAAVTRMARMHYFYLKSVISGEKFNESLYEGKWRFHQPYVLTIISLICTILSVIILPTDTNWYNILAAFCVIVLFFYFS